MVVAIVLGSLAVYLAIAGCYLGTRRRYAQIRSRGPARPVVGADELTPFELGLLAGGNQRMGEVALAELYLSGRAVARGHGTVSRPEPVERACAPLAHSPAPFTRLLEARLPEGRPVPAEQLVWAAAKGDPATALLWRLRRLGLFFPPGRLAAVRAVRHAAWGAHALIGVAGVLFGGFAVVWLVIAPGAHAGALVPAVGVVALLAYPFLLHLAVRLLRGIRGAVAAAFVVTVAVTPVSSARWELATALGLFAGWCALYGVYRLTGGKLGPRTMAGDAVLAEARAGLTRCDNVDAALRMTALFGFRQLRRCRPGPDRLTGPVDTELSLVRSFASACGRGVGSADSGLGGNFAGDGGSGDWGGDGGTPATERQRPRPR